VPDSDAGRPRSRCHSGVTAAFTYDTFGRRTRKTISGQTTDYLYDWDNPVQELSGGTVLANLLTGLGIDECFTRTDGSGRRTLLGDALGSILALSDDAGVVQTAYTYEPFGQTTVTGQSNGNALQYTGRENDGTGLYYYRARYYNPTRGRFIAEDPLEFFGGDVNLYAYVWNAPTNFTDPTGELVAQAAGCAVGGAIGYSMTGRGKGALAGSAAGALATMAPGAALAGCARFPGACMGVMNAAAALAGVSGPRAAKAAKEAADLKKAKDVFQAIQERGGTPPPGVQKGWLVQGRFRAASSR